MMILDFTEGEPPQPAEQNVFLLFEFEKEGVAPRGIEPRPTRWGFRRERPMHHNI